MTVATRAEALERLAAFVPHAGRTYAATRNEDRGPSDRTNVSTLAPYIRARLITEEEVLRAVLARHSRSAAQKFVQEVFWRTYWKGWLESHPLVWAHYRRDLDAQYAYLEREPDRARRYDEATCGKTGIPAFDAWARELIETSYVHNHARMWFASIWIFTLQLPWELGADFFMRHLLCGDPASNTLSWRWVAGLQTRGKTYLATPGNIRRYTDGRLDPGSSLATTATALVGPAYSPATLPQLNVAPHEERRGLLLLHDDDAGIDTLPLGALDIVHAMGLCAAGVRSPKAVAAPVTAFAQDAIADALSRAPHGDPAAVLSSSNAAECAERIIAAARRANAPVVLVPFAPVGPLRDALLALRPRIDAAGLQWVEVGRRYDAVTWPYATRGFFNLKDKIPAILRELALDEDEDESARTRR